jgi:hypothetical protein
MALAAMTSILLIASCGSGGSPARGNNNGFTDSDLSGTYVFSSAGSDANGYPLALAGTLSANGSGSITGGTIDIVTADPSITPASPVAQAITGSYNVNTDGRGQATLTSTAYGTFVLDFVLTSTSHGLVTEYDSNGTGSGTIDLQTAVTSLSQLAGSYAFSFAGADSGYNSFATAGAFTLNSSGVIAAGAGVEDFNDGGVPELDQSLTSNTAILGTGTGPGTITLTTESHALTYDFYPIDTTHIKFIETDYAEFLSGDAFTQSGASSIPTGTMVFTMAGGTSAGPIADGGTMTSTGDGNFTGGLEDINNAGTVVTQVPFSGIGSAGGSIGGRVITNLTGFDPNLDDSAQWVIYPFAGGLLMLESDSVNVTLGTGYVQSATSFTAPAGYGLNLAGENTYNGGSEVDDIAQFNATTAATNNMSGILDENVGGAEDSGSLSGTYTPGSPNSITATASNTYLGGLTLAYYVVDSSSVIFVDIDPVSTTDLGQVAVGTFEAQSTPGGGAAVHSHMAIVHPAVRPHGAWRRK